MSKVKMKSFKTDENQWKGRVDPLQASWRDSRKVDWFWMRDGYKLTAVQRIGYGLISTLALILGANFLDEAWSFLLAKDVQVLMWAPAGLIFMYLGLRGFLNSLYFKKRKS